MKCGRAKSGRIICHLIQRGGERERKRSTVDIVGGFLHDYKGEIRGSVFRNYERTIIYHYFVGFLVNRMD
jgi:hypothetical protein